MGDGAVIEVAPGARPARPVHLVFAYGADRAAAVYMRSLVTIGAGAALTLFESHDGPDGVDYQVNAAVDLVLGDRAELDHVKVGAEGREALHLSTLSATIGANARLGDMTFTTGGKVVRNQLFVRCDGAGSKLAINGASLLNGRQHADTTMLVDHAAGHCYGREVFKSVLDDASRGVFQGKIVVRRGAQKTDARMMSRALLLSDEAESDNKPELEIFADDVQCGHGATSGALDDNLKFYLMARGIPEREAEALLIQSFVAEAIEGVGARGRARRADRGDARLAGSAALGRRNRDTHAPRIDQRQLRRRPRARGLSDPRHAGLRQAARLSRQRGFGAEAEHGARPHPAGLHVRIRQRASRPAFSRQCRDRGLRGRAREGEGASSMRDGPRRSSSPATPPRRSTSSPTPSAASASRRATRSCSPSWSTTPTSCPGISCASATAR